MTASHFYDKIIKSNALWNIRPNTYYRMFLFYIDTGFIL